MATGGFQGEYQFDLSNDRYNFGEEVGEEVIEDEEDEGDEGEDQGEEEEEVDDDEEDDDEDDEDGYDGDRTAYSGGQGRSTDSSEAWKFVNPQGPGQAWSAAGDVWPGEGSSGQGLEYGGFRFRDDAEEEGEEDEFLLHFEEGVDPLKLVADSNEGGEAFQQLERLQYEALAERKRKALASKQSAEDRQAKQQKVFGATMDHIWASALHGRAHKRQRGPKKRGRRKKAPGESGLPAEVTKKLGEANLLYALSKYQEAVDLLVEVVRIAPNVPDSYHTLGLLHDAMGNRKKALNFFMIAAHLTPKDTSLWKRLAAWSMEQGITNQALYCLGRIIRADPADLDAKWDRAMLFAEKGDHRRAADAMEAIHLARPGDPELCKMLAKMLHKTGQREKAVAVLKGLVDSHPGEADLTAVNILAELHMEGGSFVEGIELIERARGQLCGGGPLPVDLSVKEGICHAYLGQIPRAQELFVDLLSQRPEECSDLFMDVGDMWAAVGEPPRALFFYRHLARCPAFDQPALWLKMAQCHVAAGDLQLAAEVYRQVLRVVPGHVESRLALANLLQTHGMVSEAVAILRPPPGSQEMPCGGPGDAWWQNPKILVTRARLQYMQGQLADFLDATCPLLNETITVEAANKQAMREFKQKFPTWNSRKGPLQPGAPGDAPAGDGVFIGYQPPQPRNVSAALSRARIRRQLAVQRGEIAELSPSHSPHPEVAAAVAEEEAAGPPLREPPLKDLFRDEAQFDLLLKTCRGLVESERRREAVDLARAALKVAPKISRSKRAQLRALGGGVATTHGQSGVPESFNAARQLALENPYSNRPWNLLHSLSSRASPQHSRQMKLLQGVRIRCPDCVPPVILAAHQSALAGHYQTALRHYLGAFKLEPSNAFLALCIGTSFLNLAAGSRVTNRNQCVLQAFAFLYKYDNLTGHSQEASYNLGRAYHQLGLVHLAVPYYEKALAMEVEDHLIPVVTLGEGCADLVQPAGGHLSEAGKGPPFARDTGAGDGAQPREEIRPFVFSGAATSAAEEERAEAEEGEGGRSEQVTAAVVGQRLQRGRCDLGREAAHNLALLYKASGADALARQLYRDFITI